MPEPLVELPVDGTLLAVATTDEIEVAQSRKLGFLGWFSIIWLVLIVALALLAPILPLSDPNASFREIASKPPIQPGHLLGGDGNGRDELARVIFGARVSLMVGFASVTLGWVIGGFLGLVAGYFKGRLDTVLSTLFNVLLSIPALVFALSL